MWKVHRRFPPQCCKLPSVPPLVKRHQTYKSTSPQAYPVDLDIRYSEQHIFRHGCLLLLAAGDTVSTHVIEPFNIAKLISDADASTLIAAVLTTSVLVHTGIISPYPVLFVPEKLLQLPPKIPEIWRLITPFLITGPKFGLLMDTYFLYTYCSGLETGSPRFSEPGSFFVYLMFIMGVIVVSQWS